MTAPFRFGARPAAAGYVLDEAFYPRSSRRAGRPRVSRLKALEHPGGMRRLLRRPADLVHLQWLAAPELDVALLRSERPLVFTAHDLLPRRTARRTRLWRHLFRRFDRIVVHSERGRDALVEFGVAPDALRVIPHPVFRSEPRRADDGRTVLAPGVIRPYKGLPDAIASVLAVPGRAPARRRRPAHPARGAPRARRRPRRVAPRLPRPTPSSSRRSPRPPSRSSPTGTSSTSPARSSRRSVRASPRSSTTSAGSARSSAASPRAGSCRPGDVAGLSRALGELLDDPGELAAAREGAARARETLTWDAAAAAHVDLYRELV